MRVPRRGVRVNDPVRGRRSGQRGGRWGGGGSAEGASVGGPDSGRGPAMVEGRDLVVRLLLGIQRPQLRRSPGGRCGGGSSLGLRHEGGRRGGRRPQPGENGGTPQLTHGGCPHASKRRCKSDRSGRCPRRQQRPGAPPDAAAYQVEPSQRLSPACQNREREQTTGRPEGNRGCVVCQTKRPGAKLPSARRMKTLAGPA